MVAPGANGDVLRPATLAEMMSPQYSVDPRMHGMGLAFWLDQLGDHRTAGHDGNVPGFASSLLVAPDDGIGVVVLTNNSSFIGAHLLATAVLRSLLGVPDPAAELPRPDVAPSPHLWPELVGYYAPEPGFLTNVRSWQMMGGEVQVLVKGRRSCSERCPRCLRCAGVSNCTRSTRAIRCCSPSSSDGLVVPVAFTRNEPGCIDGVVVGPPANARFHRRSTLRSTRVRGGSCCGWRLGRRPPPMAAAQAPALLVRPRAQLGVVRVRRVGVRAGLEVGVPEVVHCSARPQSSAGSAGSRRRLRPRRRSGPPCSPSCRRGHGQRRGRSSGRPTQRQRERPDGDATAAAVEDRHT